MTTLERSSIFFLFLNIFQIVAAARDGRSVLNSPRIINAIVPPDHKQYTAMARFVVHEADWSALATISIIPKIKGVAFANIVSMSDGTVEKSIGVPYFYLTPLDFTHNDLAKDNRCTVSVSLEQTSYCRDQNLDPDDPRCARVMLSGVIVRVSNETAEYDFAKEALFSRHDSMRRLPENHHFYVAKLVIKQIVMLDWFGGPIYIKIDDFLSYNDGKTYFPYPYSSVRDFEDNRI